MNSSHILPVKALHVFLVFILLFTTTLSSAQTEKGSFSVGNSFFVSAHYKKHEPKNIYVQVNTGAGYFILNNLELGLTYNVTKTIYDEWGEYHNFDGKGLGVYSRHYFFLNGAPEKKKVTLLVFLQAGANFIFTAHYTKRDDDAYELQFAQKLKQFSVNPGFSLQIGKKWSFECIMTGITYETYTVGSNSRDYFGIGLNSIHNDQKYNLRKKDPGFTLLGGIRYHF